VRKAQVEGRHPGRPFFKEELDGILVLLGIISAGRIDERATRLQEVKGPKEQRPLERHEAGPGPNRGGKSPLDARPERSLGGTGHVNECPMEAAMEGELLAGVTGNDGVGHPESLEVGD
jgi:hypothetical protein